VLRILRRNRIRGAHRAIHLTSNCSVSPRRSRACEIDQSSWLQSRGSFGVDAGAEAHAEEHGRIKKKPPTVAEAAPFVSETAMNGGILQSGDIVVTTAGSCCIADWPPDGFSTSLLCPIPCRRNLKRELCSNSRRG
jgi:hypothetical protein